MLKSIAQKVRETLGQANSTRVVVKTPQPFTPESDTRAAFERAAAALQDSEVLEVGTLQALPGRSTYHHGFFPHVPLERYLRMDIAAGADVDVVADLHGMPADWTDRFGALVAVAVFEHLERPWIAAREVARVLKPGGFFFVSTHQTFPIHGYPSDFFRFSKEALRLIFEDAGLEVEACDYSDRCVIIPPASLVPHVIVDDWNRQFPSYVRVEAVGRKRV